MFKGFTRTKPKHIQAAQENLKEEHVKQLLRMRQLEEENRALQNEINRELYMCKTYMEKDAPEFKLRIREENNLKHQESLLQEEIEKQEVEIEKIKKSQRYTTYQELRIYVEELQEELSRLRKLCKTMKSQK